MADVRPLTRAEIDALVRRALEGEAALDELVSEALFGGGGPPEMWADWPREARDSWDFAVWRFRLLSERLAWPPRGKHLKPAAIWRAVEVFSTEAGPWWKVPDLTWPAMGRVLGIGARSAQYYLRQVHGWRFGGRGLRRYVQEAPCLGCGRIVAARLLSSRRCERCRRVDQKQGA